MACYAEERHLLGVKCGLCGHKPEIVYEKPTPYKEVCRHEAGLTVAVVCGVEVEACVACGLTV